MSARGRGKIRGQAIEEGGRAAADHSEKHGSRRGFDCGSHASVPLGSRNADHQSEPGSRHRRQRLVR